MSSDNKKQKIEKYNANLKCDLTPKEVADRADRAANLLADRDSKEEEMKAHQKHAKGVIETIDAEVRSLSGEVRSRSTYRQVECERRYDWDAGTYREVRLDTGEVLFERPLNANERQMEFDPPGGANLDDEFEAA